MDRASMSGGRGGVVSAVTGLNGYGRYEPIASAQFVAPARYRKRRELDHGLRYVNVPHFTHIRASQFLCVLIISQVLHIQQCTASDQFNWPSSQFIAFK